MLSLQYFFNYKFSGAFIFKIVTVLFFVLSYLTNVFAESIVESEEVVVVENVYKIIDKDLIRNSFDKGSSELSDQSRSALVNFSKLTRKEANVDRFIVASWSDENYPSKGQLSSAQKKLAEMRAEHIKSALESTGKAEVDSFEMTKQPNWIQRVFSTETAEIKDQGLNMTSNQRLLKEIGKKLQDKGVPMSAVVVAKFKNEISAK